MTKRQKSKNIWGYFFISGNMIWYLLFTIIPIGISFFASMTSWDALTPMKFIGIDNYTTLFSDKRFLQSLVNTVMFTLYSVPLGMLLAVVVAVVLNGKKRNATVYRSMIFLPVVTSWVAISMVWALLMGTDFGLINTALGAIGIEPIPWFTNKHMALISISLISIWKNLGYNMTIYLAGLQGIPSSVYEAAEIDGVNQFQKFIYITLPLLANTTYFIAITSIITSMQVFDPFYMIVKGTTVSDSATNISFYLYQNAFSSFRMGYACAVAYVLFIIIFGITLIQTRLSKTKIEY